MKRHEFFTWALRVGFAHALLAASVLLPARAYSSDAPGAKVTQSDAPGFLVLAADRGFLGNEEIRDAFAAFAPGRNAELAFVTDQRTQGTLEQAFQELARRGAQRVVALPLFLSAADPRLSLAMKLMSEPSDGISGLRLPLSWARPFGESYLAVEVLADRFRAITRPQGRRVVVVGHGAHTRQDRERMEQDWQRIAEHAARGFGFSEVRTLVWYDRRSPEWAQWQKTAGQTLTEAAQGESPVLVPFHLGRKLDSMMSLDAELKYRLPANSELAGDSVQLDAAFAGLLGAWMAREANRHFPPEPEDLGVVVLAHGADYHWNETMRQATRPLERRYKVEHVFSMADQPLIERTVRKLEQRGARAIVIVRVFGQSSAFRGAVERMIGWDVERDPGAGVAHAAHAADHGHDGGGGNSHGQHHDHGASGKALPPPRIRSAVPISTVGGLEADPLFASALLDRARELSREPGRETVILTAHGSGDDAANEHWLKMLEAIAQQMRAGGGSAFRAIRFATWREDWPDKQAPWIAKVRDMVQEAARDGRAIVIPARTTGRGPERAFLDGLEFELGEGFAPHPLFARWVEKQVHLGLAALGSAEAAGFAAARDEAQEGESKFEGGWVVH